MEGENRVTLLGKPEDGGTCVLSLHFSQSFRTRLLWPEPLIENDSFANAVRVEYIITMPSMYARGILFGKMVLELGDTCVAKNEKHNLYCDLEFKTKVCSVDNAFLTSFRLSCPFGSSRAVIYSIDFIFQGFFSGTYNALSGKLRHKSTEIGEISGRWSHVMEIKTTKVRISSLRCSVTFLTFEWCI